MWGGTCAKSARLYHTSPPSNPSGKALRHMHGSVEADVARGLALRMDHGSQYLSDHFLNQIKYWGIRPSFCMAEEPEPNGVAERWQSDTQVSKRSTCQGRSQPRRRALDAVADFIDVVQPELAPREASDT